MLTAEQIADIAEALGECDEYFDDIADADFDQDGYIPNEEMLILAKVRKVIAILERLP